MMKILITLSIAFAMTACSSLTNYSQQFAGSCYRLVKPSILYRGWCAKLDSSLASSDTCLGIQSLPIRTSQKFGGVPLTSYEQFKSDSEFWNKVLFYGATIFNDHAVLDQIAADTPIQIIGVYEKQWGIDGYFWAVRAQILGGSYKNTVVTLPTYKFHLGDSWTNLPPAQKGTDSFVLNGEYLRACSIDSIP